jgi:hypothetical protein
VSPPGTTLIQVAFGYGFNYDFVVTQAKAAAQIFQLLGPALSYGVSVDASNVQVQKLIPLDTNPTLGYTTTLAIVAFPQDLVQTLSVQVVVPSSKLYQNSNQLVYNLTANINPAISIYLGSGLDGSSGGSGDGSSASASATPNPDVFSQPAGASDQTPAQRGTTAGIAVASIGVAAAYGAAMFVIARRYKRKRTSHRRTSSLSNPASDEMRQTGSPALMGGALLSRDFETYGGVAGGRNSHGSGQTERSGRSGDTSVRTAYISAPVAAENSLGWN